MSKAYDFLVKHGMAPEMIDPSRYAVAMCEDMENGLAARPSAMPMIPTYIRMDGQPEIGQSVIVIDAGGTNFRCALATFTEDGLEISDVEKNLMPGIEKSATWDEFISFVADMVQGFTDKADYIGFCFSYNATITPEIDGRVNRIDKEVVITDSAGKLVGQSLVNELEKRGIRGKRVFVLNDTVAALLGASYDLDKSAFSGFIGQISGTGVNTCCLLPYSRIGKLERNDDTSILINLESGLYDGFPQSDFDAMLDRGSINTGEKIMEKMIAGAYLGELAKLMLLAAADEGFLSPAACEKVRRLGKVDSSYVDAWSCGSKLELVCAREEDEEFVREICYALFDRSARCLCTNLLAIMFLTDSGSDSEKPVCVCAEGSLIDKSRYFRPLLEKYLKEYSEEKCGRYAKLRIGYETTLPGSAVAAIYNI